MKQKDILFIFVSSTIVVFAWVGFNLHHKWATTTISPDLQIQLNPINPEFDMETVSNLKKRQRVEPINNLNDAAQASATPTQAIVPTSTPAPTQTQEITIPEI